LISDHFFLMALGCPLSITAEYLGMTLDAKLRWKAHIKKKRKELQIKFQKNVLVAWTPIRTVNVQ
jgi:hypothetical protein